MRSPARPTPPPTGSCPISGTSWVPESRIFKPICGQEHPDIFVSLLILRIRVNGRSEFNKLWWAMIRVFSLLLAGLMILSACTETSSTSSQIGADGLPLPKVYRIRNAGKVQFRMLDSVNSLRTAAGVAPVQMNAQLTAASATHSRDMSKQNRPWHFGSDGSSPIDRVQRAGYPGQMLGENISETYETELETLAAWMDEKGTRAVLLDKGAVNMGFSWFQENNGKIWWTLVMGG